MSCETIWAVKDHPLKGVKKFEDVCLHKCENFQIGKKEVDVNVAQKQNIYACDN